MLQHTGIKRTFRHNFLLAVFFAFVAGMVNVAGLLLLYVFTTNITGHFGELAVAITTKNTINVIKVFIWILTFLSGSFFASICVNGLNKFSPKISYIFPIIIEMVCFLVLIFLYEKLPRYQDIDFRIFLLFFSMGLQNGIVSVVSGNVVRTTHLTGMITDFGLAFGEILFNKEHKKHLQKKMLLSAAIVISFLCGGIIAGIYSNRLNIHFFYIPIIVLFFIVMFDYSKTYILRSVRFIKKMNVE